jgi:hypothetical protein
MVAAVLDIHALTAMVLASIVLSGLFLALAFVADAYIPLPPVPPTVTKERTHGQEVTRPN